MKLVILYGPPATGKLTVARELSKLTGYMLFHNHLIADLASSIFPFGTKQYSDLAESIRLLTIKSAAKAKSKGLIMTFAYGVETFGSRDDLFLKKVINLSKKFRVSIYFVKVFASDKALEKRIGLTSRKKFKKLTNFKTLQTLRKRFQMDEAVPFVKSTLLDTSKLTPIKAAKFIINNIQI